MKIINRDKNGNIIKDLSKVQIPREIEEDILEILNPTLTVKKEEE